MHQNQLSRANHVVSVFAGNTQCEFTIIAYNEILFYISYSLYLAFRLCSSMIVFYTSLEVTKFIFTESKSSFKSSFEVVSEVFWKQFFRVVSDVFSSRHSNTGLVSSCVSFTSLEEGASLSLAGHSSNDGITIKITYEVDALLHRPASHPIFSYWVG